MSIINFFNANKNQDNPLFIVFRDMSENQKMSLINLLYIAANLEVQPYSRKKCFDYINKFAFSLDIHLRRCHNYYETEGLLKLILDLKTLGNEHKEYLISALWRMISLYSNSIMKSYNVMMSIFEQLGVCKENYISHINKTQAIMKYFFGDKIENEDKEKVSTIFGTLSKTQKEVILYLLNKTMIQGDNIDQIFCINKYCEILKVDYISVTQWFSKTDSELTSYLQNLSDDQKEQLSFAASEMISCSDFEYQRRKEWLDTILNSIGINNDFYNKTIDRFKKIKQELSIFDIFRHLPAKRKTFVFEFLHRYFSFLYISSNDKAYYSRRFELILNYKSVYSLPYMIEISDIDFYQDVKSIDQHQKEVLVSAIFGIMKNMPRPLKLDKISLSLHFERIGIDEVMFRNLLKKSEILFKFLEYD